jgi:hypothetical protein
MRQTTLQSEVLVVLDGKPTKGVIDEVFSPGAARIQLGDKSTVQASYSSTGEEGTFHYPDETKAVKQSDTFGKPLADPAAAAESAAQNDEGSNKKKAGK